MAKRNWSLALAIKDEQRKKHQRTQTRQRNEYLHKKLQNADIDKLYSSLKYHRSRRDPNTKTIHKLEEEWDFVIKNKLHPQSVARLLEREKKQTEAENKLWGQRSVYFNPELNPLGKPPTIDGQRLPNVKGPLKNVHKYEPDARIAMWHIDIPEGSRPRFYKTILNTEKPRINTTAPTGTPKRDPVPANWDLQSDSESGRETDDNDS